MKIIAATISLLLPATNAFSPKLATAGRSSFRPIFSTALSSSSYLDNLSNVSTSSSFSATDEQATEIRKNNGQHTQALEPLAGLARVHLRLGDATAALVYVEEILPQLNIHTYAGIVELIRIYLTCYRVLFLLEDPRATEIITMGYKILQERSAKILDTNVRQYYLENIIAHRELLTEYDTQMMG